MKLHFTPAWLRRRIEQEGDSACEAGPDPLETLTLLVRVMDTNHPDAAAAMASASALRRILTGGDA
jgi:hypothetical protein